MAEYSTNFLISTHFHPKQSEPEWANTVEGTHPENCVFLLQPALRQHFVPLSVKITPCEIFPTFPAIIFLERKPLGRIIQVEIETRKKQNIGGGAEC
jgi:hypothetical protein